jgi:nucleoside-diphosphate-sugar epimerase
MLPDSIINIDKETLSKFNNKTIFITGATGFVGGRLVEILKQTTNAKIKVLVRDYSKAMRIGRYDVEYISGTLNDSSTYAQHLTDVNIVLHCAYGNKGSIEDRKKTNVNATLELLIQCQKLNIESFVFISTISVYGIPNADLSELNETHKGKINKNDSYALDKLEAENLVLRFAKEHDFHACVLQPSAVYGPWAPSYVMRPIQQMFTHQFPLINHGKGIANIIYIDDLCQAILKAATSQKTLGEKYILNSNEKVTWSDYYTKLFAPFSHAQFKSFTAAEMKVAYHRSTIKPSIIKNSLKIFTINKDAARALLQHKWISKLASYLLPVILKITSSSKIPKKVPTKNTTRIALKPIALVDKDTIAHYTTHHYASIHKAQQDFNYKPLYNIELGMKEVNIWSNWFYN